MMFDAEAGLYVFEVILGLEVAGEVLTSPLCLIQADDADEAEDKVLEYIDGLDLDVDYWVEEMSGPYRIEQYQQELDDGEKKPFPVLDELTEEELREFVGL
jgi:hypothetical protein